MLNKADMYNLDAKIIIKIINDENVNDDELITYLHHLGNQHRGHGKWKT
jgi:hypothetical protein